ncbi:MAG: tRNA pseudouridine(13) synthase TruD [Candidatus Heimdallarchaeota archaeon]|nr:tRNA pseudouridine(13) synthase TruD [Candidatus Heimdallarchaeota archaeon]MBY8995339.1 tRNA pseudouridine(13) synthase TruD [Candidatus Heimdallarchaeota archaeon]
MVPGELRESHPIEKKMGILYYCTKTDGIDGKLRTTAYDFQVEEIMTDGRKIPIDDPDFSLGENEPGLYTEFILIKIDTESHNALYKISSALNREQSEINVAGTKDKTAYTAQKATIWRVPPEKLTELDLRGIEIRSPRTTIYQTYLGNLFGNHFTIKIREINESKDLASQKIEKIKSEIDEFNGIPNYFGHQRFGTRRPISHIIGKFLLLGEIEKAIQLYISYTTDEEAEATNLARKTFQETNDPKETIRLLPSSMIFEKQILKILSKSPRDFLGAFCVLPKNLQRIFFHAYQSYIWNLTLSERIRLYSDLSHHSIDELENNNTVLPIIGYKTDFTDNVLSDYTKSLLEKDGIKLDDFMVKYLKTHKFSGSSRAIALKANNLTYTADSNQENQAYVITQFTLQRGSYATVVLRELMKTNPLKY